ncbi:5-(carboxyamino)imidazole ribonucleotide synthase [Serpentinicella sp. ANB-PHB4]|uniref:5-(carboxyamino)imidazole ribonucleotide synthase n=1 Tax=Serpentinicella sp. ANB-PHB4 TaxID=3074076 RepID=UPI002865EFDE|nr:5-(carboxyamino)imidazole ribonucleotide synthase [Serpentinicella sp. ANB-PHB4]MDR5658588.1 5-(carboxyamino)imidazole ribonucleotide synthase [Serpentinicella sp. ANB-PHB4]
MEKKVGIIGGGQLGKMMILEGKKMGIQFVILDPSKDCPASSIADEHIVEDFYNEEKIKQLAEKVDVLTYEFEHINADYLIRLEQAGKKIYPSPSVLKVIQDKYEQKSFLKRRNIQSAPFRKVDSLGDINLAVEEYGLPVLLKSRKGGYDGKGNACIKTLQDIEQAYDILGGSSAELMVEAFVPFDKEISAIVARGSNGQVAIYPLSENIHNDNILITTIVPARVDKETEKKAELLAKKTIENFEGIGIFCVEMFVTKAGEVLVNEIAPRTHNSGHYTIEACRTSQFMQHLRAILEQPLGNTDLINPAVMLNILGEDGCTGKAKVKGLHTVLEMDNTYVHLYGKQEVQPKRKMGHVTVVDIDINKAIKQSEVISKVLKVINE